MNILHYLAFSLLPSLLLPAALVAQPAGATSRLPHDERAAVSQNNHTGSISDTSGISVPPSRRFAPIETVTALNEEWAALLAATDDWARDAIYSKSLALERQYVSDPATQMAFNTIAGNIETAYSQRATPVLRVLAVNGTSLPVLASRKGGAICYHLLPTSIRTTPVTNNGKKLLGIVSAHMADAATKYDLRLNLEMCVDTSDFQAAVKALKRINRLASIDTSYAARIHIPRQPFTLSTTSATGTLIALCGNTLSAELLLNAAGTTFQEIFQLGSSGRLRVAFSSDGHEAELSLPFSGDVDLIDTLIQTRYALSNFDAVIADDPFTKKITLQSALYPTLTADSSRPLLSYAEIFVTLQYSDGADRKGPYRLGSFESTEGATAQVLFLAKGDATAIEITGRAVYDQGNTIYQITPFIVDGSESLVTISERLFSRR